ncbi:MULTISPECIES: SDR family NAD(P)-dependent oxidoreductase [Thermocrispum]|uniref:SDR family NAD(P)-dependent oxidoreductase n=1 Tax=Thermocrispum agreste TaxID=37925 RepID=A0A2W4J7J5_9PSEU|nr:MULTISPECIES: SDR family NAD(P)-dependent oxidoreductase [Thermocrispum]PZM95180.1 MAG: SDR family NAD(P)-dependent oxidoreductase [Thermocrispum agreste]
MTPEQIFSGQTAIVTGGASGIGAATVEHIARRGGRVFSVDLSYDSPAGEVVPVSGNGFGYEAVRCDVSNEDEVERTVSSIVDAAGSPSILVNSAGTTGPQAPLWETSYDYWKMIYRINVDGTFLMCRAVIPHLTSNGYGRIVNIASMAGKEGNAGSSAYSSAKAAVIGMTKCLGKELARTGVLVNAVAPTVFTTPLNKKVNPDYHEFLISRIPLGRPGEVHEAAEMIGFLVSSRCSFSTGAVFDLSGGRAVY